MKVLITVPHYLTDQGMPGIVRELRRYADASIYVARSEDRERMDYNRAMSRDTEFRRAIRRFVSDNEDVAVIDLHSFAPNVSYADWDKHPIITLRVLGGPRVMHHKATTHFDGIGVWMGSPANDIVEEMTSMGIPTILLEVHATHKRYRRTIRQLASFINDISTNGL